MPVSAGPRFKMGVDLLPSPEIKIPNTEIGSSRQLQRLAKSGQELLIYVVENAGHGALKQEVADFLRNHLHHWGALRPGSGRTEISIVRSASGPLEPQEQISLAGLVFSLPCG